MIGHSLWPMSYTAIVGTRSTVDPIQLPKGKTDISSLGCNVSFDTWGHVPYCLHTFLFIFNGN